MKLKTNDWLTISRVIIVPIMLGCFYANDLFIHKIGMVLFMLACTTDFLDGYYARFFKTETKFGTILDPLADKWMSLASLILLVHLNQIDNITIWAIYIILFREIAIMGLRSFEPNIAKTSSSQLGKIKATILSIGIFLSIVSMIYGYQELILFANGCIILASILAVISGTNYFICAYKLLNDTEES